MLTRYSNSKLVLDGRLQLLTFMRYFLDSLLYQASPKIRMTFLTYPVLLDCLTAHMPFVVCSC